MSNVVNVVLGLVLVSVFARFLPKEVYGGYQLVYFLYSTFAILSIPGLSSAIIRHVSKTGAAVQLHVSKIRFSWAFLGIPIILSFAVYYLFMGQYSLAAAIAIASVIFPFYYTFDTWKTYYQSTGKFKLMSRYLIIYRILYTVVMVAVVVRFSGLLWFVIMVSLISDVVFNFIMLKRSSNGVKPRKLPTKAKKYGFYMNKVNILASLTARIDSLIVGLIFGPVQLAIYAIGIKSANLIQSFLQQALTVATPRIANKDTAKPRVYISIFIIFMGVALLLYMILPFVMNMLFTAKYSSSIILSQVVILFLPFFVLNNIADKHVKYYLADKKLILLNFIISPILRLILLVIFSLVWGVFGLAFVHGLRSLVYFLVNLWLMQMKRHPKN